MTTFAAIFEAEGRRVASYALTAGTPESALALLDGMPWPDGADRFRLVDYGGIERATVWRPSGPRADGGAAR